ncbi:unnamed protein product [Prorocentrum cordatum]|uniref:Sugar phosphate transporter domain-containing protein n=1 Tax=Prorocentrum cordatum TaxID=2364126 RepID=A0ABN9VF32_9DINO|nr:unnamed protein product [Polarella glacialis]
MSAARCCLLLAVAGSSAVMDIEGKGGHLRRPREQAPHSLIVGDGSKVHVSVEVLESGGMLNGTTAIEEPARIETADLCTQLGVSWLALVLSGGVFVILSRYQTLAQLLLFFGAQNFMNLLYIKAILSIHTVSQELNIRGFHAPLVLTAMQQLAGFLFLVLVILVSQLTPWAYRPHSIVSKDQAFAVMALAVCFTLNIALNNFSLSLLDMSVNVMVRSTSPPMSLLLQLCSPAKVGMVLLGVIGAALVVISKSAQKKTAAQNEGGGSDTLGLPGAHGSDDSWQGMAIPIVVLLLLPIYLIKHPVSYPGHEMATNFSVFVDIAQLSLGTVVRVMLSGIWALGYNLLLYNIVRDLSPFFASFAANFKRRARMACVE